VRLNLARTLLREQEHLPQAAEHHARDCSISMRQAYRYLEQAQQLRRPVPVGDAKLSFTVKLSRFFLGRLKAIDNWGARPVEAFRADFGPDC